MPSSFFLQKAETLEIQTYKKPKNIQELRKTHIPFSGLLKKHPYDSKKVVLITEPDSAGTSYYEFKTNDISCAEEMPAIVNIDGETITMARIWVKKKSIGIRFIPFVVEDIQI
ncbi:MAG: inorganic pyrophosphatase Ppa [Desulfobacteraceae bacterium 4572_123]|nr:MAG: inorganic pyrophosphatase Ppa [Desulfobacteraceae bacterium 4572_123]